MIDAVWHQKGRCRMAVQELIDIATGEVYFRSGNGVWQKSPMRVDQNGDTEFNWDGWLKGRVFERLYDGSISIEGSTEGLNVNVPGISRYNVIALTISGRGARPICIRGASFFNQEGRESTFYGDNSYTSGNASQTTYGINVTCVGDTIVKAASAAHVLGAAGVLGEGNDTAIITKIDGIL